MDQNDLWKLIHATGDPMAFMLYKAMQENEPPK